MTKRKRDDHEDMQEDDGMRMMIKSRKMMARIMRMVKRGVGMVVVGRGRD